jgi:hypothetical protein
MESVVAAVPRWCGIWVEAQSGSAVYLKTRGREGSKPRVGTPVYHHTQWDVTVVHGSAMAMGGKAHVGQLSRNRASVSGMPR